jgi:hypothetical protein
MRSKVSKLVETCRQAEKWLKGPKRQKSFCGFADVVELKSNIRAKHDQPFINLLARIRQGNAWNGIKPKTEAQIGTGKNYTESDYQILLSR